MLPISASEVSGPVAITKTEPKYFDGLRRLIEEKEHGLYRGHIQIRGEGMSCLRLLKEAEDQACTSIQEFDHVWLVYDE